MSGGRSSEASNRRHESLKKRGTRELRAGTPAVPRKLNRTAFDATFSTIMTPVDPRRTPPFDYWADFEKIPQEDFEGHDFSARVVDQVYQTSGGRYQHVLVRSEEPGVFLVLVLTLSERVVFGYRLINANVQL